MKFSEWADTAAGFWLRPIMMLETIARGTVIFAERLFLAWIMIGVMICYFLFAGSDYNETHRERMRSLWTFNDRSTKIESDIRLGQGAEDPVNTMNRFQPGNWDVSSNLVFCNMGNRARLHSRMHTDYWDDYRYRKSGWLWRHFMVASLNVYELRREVHRYKTTEWIQPEIGEDFKFYCPGYNNWHSEFPQNFKLNDRTIPNIRVAWFVMMLAPQERESFDYEEAFPWVVGYCIEGHCSKDDMEPRFERWRDTFSLEPAYTDGQMYANQVFEQVGTLEFWRDYARRNGVNPDNMNEPWQKTQEAIKRTLTVE